jgi:hypothetical protein
MFATPSGMAQNQQEPLNYFGTFSDAYGTNRIEDFTDFPFTPTAHEYSWAEQVYRAGDTVALVAVYKNLPPHLQHDVDQLVLEEYRKKLFRVPLFEASLLLLSSGCKPGFSSLWKRSKRLYSDSSIDRQQQKALDFISCRNPEDIVVLVMRSGQLVATMTLFPFNRKQDIPSLSYLRMDSSFNQLPDVPAMEVGRLAKATCCENHDSGQSNAIVNTMAMATAFIVAKNYALENDLLSAPDSYICGDTYGSLISSMRRFFPMKIIESTINSQLLENKSDAHSTAIYFLQRQVLGSFESANDLVSVIETIGNSRPDVSQRIKQLLESDLRQNGIKSIDKFDPEKFRVQFFYFPYHHPKIDKGFRRLDQMIQRLTARTKGTWN